MSEAEYIAVFNEELQWSIWPAYQPVPAGWTASSCRANREACLAFIRKEWLDLTPLSVTRALHRE